MPKILKWKIAKKELSMPSSWCFWNKKLSLSVPCQSVRIKKFQEFFFLVKPHIFDQGQ